MTLYTVMPPELIWEGFWKDTGAYQDIRVGGLLLQVRPTGPRCGTIVRLLDCPLEAYLNPMYAPGSEIEWT